MLSFLAPTPEVKKLPIPILTWLYLAATTLKNQTSLPLPKNSVKHLKKKRTFLMKWMIL